MPTAFLTVPINFLNAGFSILFRKGVKVAAVVATIVIAKVVDTVFIEGKYNKYWNRQWHDFSVGLNYVIF